MRASVESSETQESHEVTGDFVAGIEQSRPSPNGDLQSPDALLDEHPEVAVGAGFIGGFLLGRLVKRLGS